MDIPAVLNAIRPGCLWTLNGDDYAGLTWIDDSPKPAKKTLEDAWQHVEWKLTVTAIRAERERRYQAETDPMFFQFQRNEGDITLADWQAAVQQIRDDLPYPEKPA